MIVFLLLVVRTASDEVVGIVSTESGAEREIRRKEMPAYEAYNRGVAANGDEAIKHYREALESKPDFPEALMNLGNLVDDEESAGLYAKALDCSDHPRISAQALSNLALVRHRQYGALDKMAKEYFQNAIALAPDFVDAQFNFGRLLEDADESVLAQEQYQVTLRLDPGHDRARLNLANIFLARGDTAQAVSLQAELAQDPRASKKTRLDALNNLGQSLRQSENHAKAAQVFQEALEIDPNDLVSRANLFVARRTLCNWQHWELRSLDLITASQNALSQNNNTEQRMGLLPYDAIMLAEAPGEFIRDLASAHLLAKFKSRTRNRNINSTVHTSKADAAIGWLSFDWREHPMGYLTRKLVDFGRLLSYGENDGSELRKNAESKDFIELENATLSQVAVSAQGLEVVVDLMTHTRGANLKLAHAAAGETCVFCSYLGYPGTAGGNRYDYTIADRIVTPPEFAKRNYHEKLILLTGSYQANDYDLYLEINDTEVVHPSAPETTWCNLNNVDKFEPVSFDVWMNALRRDPSARLALLEPKQLSARQRLEAEAAARGIAPHRIVWWPRLSKSAHLARLRDNCNKFADNFIYGAHTTAADALWAGLPLITLRGWGLGQDFRFASRVGASLLEASDLGALALDSVMQFEDTLCGFQDLSHDLKRRVLSASLKMNGAFDSRAKATQLRRALNLAAEQRGQRHIVCGHPNTRRSELTPQQCVLNTVLAALNGDYVFSCDNRHRAQPMNTTSKAVIELARRLVLSSAHRNADAVHAYGLALFLLDKNKEAAARWLWSAVRLAPFTAHFWANLGRISGDAVPQLVAMRLGHAVEPSELRSALLSADLSQEKKFFAASIFLPLEARLRLSLGAAYDAVGDGDSAWQEWAEAVPGIHAQKEATEVQVQAVELARSYRKNRRVVVIYCDEYGQTWWPNWGPSSLTNGGLGGSEEAVVFVARELAKRGGHHIEIYTEPSSSDLGPDPIFPDHVFWLHHATWDPSENNIHVFVAWRYHISATLAPLHSLSYVWLQDVPPYSSWTQSFLKSINGVFVLSKFHAETLPPAARKLAIVAPNGIAPEELVDGPLERSLIFTYGSAPNRGLYDVLTIWPLIHAELPQAELHIYYGFSPAFRKWGQQNIEYYSEWETELLRLLDQDGVVYHGMVDHMTLAQGYANASFLLYPTTYPETGCVTVMKAMAMGALPITSRYVESVVPELTVHFDLGPIEPRTAQTEASITLGPRPDPDWLRTYAEAAVSAANMNAVELLQKRKDTIAYARSTFFWAHIARTWDHTFTSAGARPTLR